MSRHARYGPAALAALLVAAGVAIAEPRGEAPPPDRRLNESARTLVKQPSYRVVVEIEVGISDNPEHKLKEVTFRESYAGDVFRGRLMHVADKKAFQTHRNGVQTGVAYIEGHWRDILASPDGVQLNRLFSFPELLLSRALKYSRSAEYVDKGGDEENASGEDDASAGSEAKGKTVVVEGKDGKKQAAWPRIVRVEAPVKEALDHVIEAQNSGCVSGG